MLDGLHLPHDELVCISSGSVCSGCEFLLVWLGAGGEMEVYGGAGEAPQLAKDWAVMCCCCLLLKDSLSAYLGSGFCGLSTRELCKRTGKRREPAVR